MTTTRRRPGRIALGVERCEPRLALTADSSLPTYDLGTPVVADLWVDPTAGNDAASGISREQAVRTLTEAWRRVPAGTTLSQGVRINLAAGSYSEAMVPNYWENRLGTAAAPIIVRAVDGPGTARLPTVNVFGCSHLSFDGLDISAGGGDVLHFEACSFVLLRNTTIRGLGTIDTYAVPQEALKVNQCRHIYIENCDISGAWDNAVDFVAVQDGHVVGSRIHRAGDWAMYAKGGSANLVIMGNEFFDAGTGGFTAGQGTGFEFMVAPWLQYEAVNIRFTNNVIHDTQGAGIGVNGGSQIVMTDNVMYRVGSRSHVIEVGFGLRSCDGNTARCATSLAQGGWGTTTPGGEEPIPNSQVVIANNVVLNPDGFVSRWQQFAVATPRTPTPGSNIPSPAVADDGLQIFGNVIWNGAADHPLGIEQPGLAADVAARNLINTLRPQLVAPERGDYRVVPGTLPTTPIVIVPPPVSPPPTVVTPTPGTPPGVLPPPVGPAPRQRLTAQIRGLSAATRRPVTSFTIVFSQAVTGVTLDDFVLARGRRVVSLATATLSTSDNRSFTITNIAGTNLAGGYTLRLKLAGTGIADAWSRPLSRPTSASWRMVRTVTV